MRRSFQLLTLLVLPALAWADGLSDLRASLQRLHGRAPIRVSVDYSNREEATSLVKPVVHQGLLQIQLLEDGPSLREDWILPQLDAVDQELRQLRNDPRALTPVQDATKELDAPRLRHLLNQAEDLSQILDGSQFKSESREVYEGKSARLLIFTFRPAIRPDLQGRVSHMEATFKLWMAEEGLPMAAETFMDYEGKHSRLYGRFHVRSLVTTTYTVLSQRLVVASQTSEDLVYDTGEKMETRKTLTLRAAG
jgi:hypothetical protein